MESICLKFPSARRGTAYWRVLLRSELPSRGFVYGIDTEVSVCFDGKGKLNLPVAIIVATRLDS